MTEDITPDGSQGKAKKTDSGESIISRFQQWVLDSYNGLFKIVVQPLLPKLRLTMLVVIAFVVGLVWAYTIRPTKFYNASPSQLSEGARDQWVRLVAGSYDAGIYNADATRDLLLDIENPSEVISRLITNSNPGSQCLCQQLTE